MGGPFHGKTRRQQHDAPGLLPPLPPSPSPPAPAISAAAPPAGLISPCVHLKRHSFRVSPPRGFFLLAFFVAFFSGFFCFTSIYIYAVTENTGVVAEWGSSYMEDTLHYETLTQESLDGVRTFIIWLPNWCLLGRQRLQDPHQQQPQRPIHVNARVAVALATVPADPSLARAGRRCK